MNEEMNNLHFQPVVISKVQDKIQKTMVAGSIQTKYTSKR